MLVGLIAEVDEATESGVFYDRVCHALCALTPMRRAALLLHDDSSRTVVPMGSFGVDPALVRQIEGTLDETPIARRALEEDRVIEVAGDLATHLPPRYADLADTEAITCTPIAAGGRWLGVLFADRAGHPIRLDSNERETMMTFGRLAALTASVEHSTERRERVRQLKERVDLTRELHEQVIQRLFGVLLVLGADVRPSSEELRRCNEELRNVVGELRRALARPTAPSQTRRATNLAETLGRLVERRPELRLEWGRGVEVPEELEPLTHSVLAEALRNADRHASPERIDVRVSAGDGTFVLEIENDGLRDGRGTPGGGLGLRLAVLEALRYEGLIEFGPSDADRWRVRLVVPLESRA